MEKTATKELEKRVKELEEINKTIINELRSLKFELDNIEQRTRLSTSNESVESRKITYLTEANEQMFQQLVRLRQLVEDCIEKNEVPTHEQYYEALKGET